jgi:ankyrin repeat protein
MLNPDLSAIQLLLEAGADIGARDEEGITPLMYASWNNTNPEVLITLLNAGADANARNNAGESASNCAMENRK